MKTTKAIKSRPSGRERTAGSLRRVVGRLDAAAKNLLKLSGALKRTAAADYAWNIEEAETWVTTTTANIKRRHLKPPNE
jgi:cytochrome c2